MSKQRRHVKWLAAAAGFAMLGPGPAMSQRLDPLRDPLRLEPRVPVTASELELSGVDEDVGRGDRSPDGFTVHLASYYTVDDALAGWAILSRRHPQLTRWNEPLLADVDLEDRGLFVRLLAGPLPSRAEADQLCAALHGAGAYCVPATLAGEFLPALDGSDG